MTVYTHFRFRPLDRWPGELTRDRSYSPFRGSYSDTRELLAREALAVRSCSPKVDHHSLPIIPTRAPTAASASSVRRSGGTARPINSPHNRRPNVPDTPSSTVEVEEIRPCPDGTFNVVFKGAGCDLNFNVDAIIAMGLLPPCDGHIHIVEWIDGTINAVHCPGLYDGLMSCAVEVELPGKTWKDFNFPTLSDFTGHLGMDRSRIGPIGPGVDGSWSWKTRSVPRSVIKSDGGT